MTTSKPLRAFRVNKFVREKILEDIIYRKGLMWLSTPRHAALHKAIAAKFHEEWAEAAKASGGFATSNGQLVEELGDVLEVCHFTREVLVAPTQASPSLSANSRGYPDFTQVLNAWHQLSRQLKLLAPDDENLSGRLDVVELAETTALSFRQHAEDYNLTFEQINKAWQQKREQRGRLVNAKLEAVALPAGDEWVPVFAEKFDPLDDITLLNPGKAMRAWPGGTASH